MATISFITPGKTTTKTITAQKAVKLLDGFCHNRDYLLNKLPNETKEEFLHRKVMDFIVVSATVGSKKLAEANIVVTPEFVSGDIT